MSFLLLSFTKFVLVLLLLSLGTSVGGDQGAIDIDAKGSIDVSDATIVEVYYINLSRRPDREHHMRSEFQRHGIVPPKFVIRRFEAIDGLTHNFTPQEKALFATFDTTVGKNSSHNTHLLKANSLSHLGVWTEILKSGVPQAVVFQDDAQLSKGFVDALLDVIANNPSDAILTWLGLNQYASGSVSRSAPLKADTYDADQFSTVVPNTNQVIGRCRPNLIATNSLAYLVTSHGAKTLVEEFGNPNKGWSHHTDHAMVEFLDRRGVSYISRKIVATTHDDGVLGSDIFNYNKREESALRHAADMVIRALAVARLPTDKAVMKVETDMAESGAEFKMSKAEKTESWLHGLSVECEEMQCLYAGCPSSVVTHAFLSWNGNSDECILGKEETCGISDDSDTEFDEIGVRRRKGRKRLLIAAAAADVSPASAAEAIPAWWTLESWASSNHDAPTMPRPRFSKGEIVEINLSPDADINSKWEVAVIVAVGYHDPGWAEGTVSTYIVKPNDDRLLTVAIDHVTRIRRASTTSL